jgi:hypothetical protein
VGGGRVIDTVIGRWRLIDKGGFTSRRAQSALLN